MDEEYKKKQKKLLKNHIREFYNSEITNNNNNKNLIYNYNDSNYKHRHSSNNFKYKEYDDIEEEIIVDQSNVIKKSFEKNNLRYSNVEYNDEENNNNKKFNYSPKKNNDDIKYIDKNLLLNIPNKIPSQLKLEKQNLQYKYKSKSNLNNDDINENNKKYENPNRNLKNIKFNEIQNYEIDERNRKPKSIKNRNNNNNMINDKFNLQADLKIEILERIKNIEEKEKIKEKEKHDFINNKNYLKNKHSNFNYLDDDYINERECKRLDYLDEDDSGLDEKIQNDHNDNYISDDDENFENVFEYNNNKIIPQRKEKFSDKKQKEISKPVTEISLKKDNFNKLNKIILLLSQKFLNIIVSIISSKLKKYFLMMFENAKFIKIKRLGFDIGEKNAVINFIDFCENI